jgi:hypothetical protein
MDRCAQGVPCKEKEFTRLRDELSRQRRECAQGQNEADQNPTMARLRRHDEYED